MNHTPPARAARQRPHGELRTPARAKESPVKHGSRPSKRTYILDTNVLLYDPHALEVFEEHDVVIPMTVIEEIDRFKRDINETGRNARQTSRMLDDLRQQGSLKAGVSLPGGGRLRVDFAVEDDDIPITWGADSNDNKILRTAVRLHGQLNGDVALVTRDTNMRLKCDALGVVAEDYENAHLAVDEQWSGVVERWVPPEIVAAVWAEGEVRSDLLADVYPNTFVVLRSAADDNQTAMVRVRAGGFRLVPRHKEGAWGVFARNKEQLFALDLLLDPDVQLVTLNGMAGTGKTLLAIAAGLRQVADQQRYRKMLVSRPVFPLGRDIGFLPGDIGEKLNPWMKPIFDNLEHLLSSRPERRRTNEPEYQYLLDQKIVEVEALTYIRGRSIPAQFLIIDEAQNLTPHEVKTVLTRAGDGTKVVLTGDPFQIDNPYVDELSNGLTYAVERFKDDAIAGHVTLKKGERSALAELAARRL
jgi:PhoH-like ATPase